MSARPRRRSVMVGSVAVLALAALLAGCRGGGGGAADPHIVTGPLGVRPLAELDVVSGATTVLVRAADLGGRLYEVSTPPSASSLPRVVVDGDVVQVSLVSGGGGSGPSDVLVSVSSRVAWQIRLDGGATAENVDLSGGRLASLDFGAGSSHIDATLPKPTGTTTVRMSGGASVFALHLPAGVPARVLMNGGAGSATVDGQTRAGIAGGVVLTAQGDATGGSYVIDNSAGVSDFTLDRR